MSKLSIDDGIESMIFNNKLCRFENELNDKKIDSDRKDKIEDIINNMKKSNKKDDEMDKYFAELVANQFKKRWTSLSDELKRDRIKLYCEERELDDKMINDINDLYDNGKLKGKIIDYDKEGGKLSSINI
jgi:hypothetical protein